MTIENDRLRRAVERLCDSACHTVTRCDCPRIVIGCHRPDIGFAFEAMARECEFLEGKDELALTAQGNAYENETHQRSHHLLPWEVSPHLFDD